MFEVSYFYFVRLLQSHFPSDGRLFGAKSPLMPLMNNLSQFLSGELPSRQHVR